MPSKQPKPLRILFVLEHFYPYLGGAEQLFWVLSTALAKAGHEVTVVTTLFRRGLPASETIEGVYIRRVRCYNRFLFSLFSLPQVWRLAKDCDLVHTTSYNAALPAWLGARLRSQPVIITFHEVWGQLWWQLPYASLPQRLAFYLWEQLLLRLPFQRFIAVSEATRRALLQHGIAGKRALRIYNGLAYEDFRGWQHQPPERFTYTYFGRLGISKGLDLLLPAAAALAEKYPESRLRLIIPTYPQAMFQRVQRELERLQLSHHVELLHNLSRSDLFEAICTSSCVVIPSYSEGFCFVAAETVALEVPVVSSQRAALSEVVGGTYLAVNNQTVEAWASALEQAYHGHWQQKAPPRFELEESVEAYISLYRRLSS